MTEQNKNEASELEIKWREEAKTVAENSGAAKPYHDLITNGYLAARKAAQVEIDKLDGVEEEYGKTIDRLDKDNSKKQREIERLNEKLKDLKADRKISDCEHLNHCKLELDRDMLNLRDKLKDRDQEISKLKVEIDQAIKDEKDWGFILSLKDQLKDSHDEIDRLKLSQPIYSRREIENKLKSLEQENERLKNKLGMFGAYGTDECHECSFGRVTVFKAHTKCIECAPEEYREEFVENHGAQLKERDQLIKELIDTFDLFDEVPLPFKIVNKMESVVKKARKLTERDE